MAASMKMVVFLQRRAVWYKFADISEARAVSDRSNAGSEYPRKRG
jgi:hypothetical protein